jgi:hypothetical protein
LPIIGHNVRSERNCRFGSLRPHYGKYIKVFCFIALLFGVKPRYLDAAGNMALIVLREKWKYSKKGIFS